MKHKTSEMMAMLDQSHVMRYMDELTADEKKNLVDQIDSLDLSVLGVDAAEGREADSSPFSLQLLRRSRLTVSITRRSDFRLSVRAKWALSCWPADREADWASISQRVLSTSALTVTSIFLSALSTT